MSKNMIKKIGVEWNVIYYIKLLILKEILYITLWFRTAIKMVNT